MISDPECRCWSSPSAPTPRGGRLEKIGNAAVGLRRRFRPALRLTSPLGFTRDASAHESAAVRRHLAPGATGNGGHPVVGLCRCLGRVGGSPFAGRISACCH